MSGRRLLPGAAVALLAGLLGATSGWTQSEGPPRPSPLSTVSQVVGVSRVEITYSRPAVAGREIWGSVVPWGEVWSTGAYEATRFELSDDARIDGEPLGAGVYGLFAIPSPDEWTLIFHREPDPADYDPANDALRIRVRPRTAEFQERFLVFFPSVGADSATVALAWEHVLVPFEVAFDVDRIALERARELVARATPADGRLVWSWANYLYQRDIGTDEALTWAADLAAAAPMYWTHALHARLLARHERFAEAAEAAARALARVEAEAGQPGVEADAAALAEERESWGAAPPPPG